MKRNIQKFENEKWWGYWYWYFLTRRVIIIGNMYEGGVVISKFQIIHYYLVKGVFPRGPVRAHGWLQWWWSSPDGRSRFCSKCYIIWPCSGRWRCRRGSTWGLQGGSPGEVAEIDIFCVVISCSRSKGRPDVKWGRVSYRDFELAVSWNIQEWKTDMVRMPAGKFIHFLWHCQGKYLGRRLIDKVPLFCDHVWHFCCTSCCFLDFLYDFDIFGYWSLFLRAGH